MKQPKCSCFVTDGLHFNKSIIFFEMVTYKHSHEIKGSPSKEKLAQVK